MTRLFISSLILPFLLSMIPAMMIAAPGAGEKYADSLAPLPADTIGASWDGGRARVLMSGMAVVGFTARSQYLPVVNLDYRWASPVGSFWPALGFGAEGGVNLIFTSLVIADGDVSNPAPRLTQRRGLNFVFPYFKASPELRLDRGYLSTQVGFTSFASPRTHLFAIAVVPFIDLSGGYRFDIDRVGAELEAGVNVPDYARPGAMPYMSAGIAFR
jgi:hypothetical protein